MMVERKKRKGEKVGFLGWIKAHKWIVTAVLAGVLGGTYVIVSAFFMSHFFFGTTLNGMSVSACTAENVQEKARQAVAGYQLKIRDKDGREYKIDGEDFDLSQKWNNGIGELVGRQNGFLWLAKVFRPEHLELAGIVEYDEAKLKKQLESQEFMDNTNAKDPVNATISDYTEDGFQLVPSKSGTRVMIDELLLTVEKTILALEDEVDIEKSGCYEQPEIGDDDQQLLAKLDKLNQCAKMSITYETGEEKEVLDIHTFKDWMHVSKDREVSFDKDKIRAYAESLSRKYNTCYSAKKLKTSWGKVVTIENSHYGWKVDEEAEAKQIAKDLKEGKPVNREINYSMKANSHGKNDYGDSYVEVNITAQHLYVYKDGKAVLDTDFVSGNTSKGNGTPPGAYTLTYKQKDAVLRGDNYESPVKFWMPFYGNYGLHDASWRGSFGGSIYKYSGSHGCVNLPTSAASEIFKTIDKGWPVLVYTTDGTTGQENAAAAKKNEQENRNAASEVEKAIESAVSGKVTKKNAEAIGVAADAYASLSDSAKKLVKNADKLEAAQSELKKQQEKEEKEKEKAKKEKAKKEKAKKKAQEKAKKEAAEKAKREAAEKAKKEAEEKAKREAAEKAKREAEEKAKREAEEKAKSEEQKKEGENSTQEGNE